MRGKKQLPQPVRQMPPVSKIRKLGISNAVNPPLVVPSLSEIATLGVSQILTRLHDISHAFDTRSHRFNREMGVAGYAMARRLKRHPTDWPKFCADPFWQGHRQGPKVDNKSTILRHTLVRIFGKGDKRASDWKARLTEHFDSDVPIEEVRQQFGRKTSVNKSDKNGFGLRRARADIIKIDGSMIAGQYDLGLLESKQGRTCKIRVEEGNVCPGEHHLRAL